MTDRIVLDTGPLGMITNPKWNKAALEWLKAMFATDRVVMIPEIVDYELRRNMILENMDASIQLLDQLKELLVYLPIDTPTMLHAASLWAEARKIGKPTAADKALDGDVILAAQALLVDAVVATDNVKHLDLFVTTQKWSEIGFDNDSETSPESSR